MSRERLTEEQCEWLDYDTDEKLAQRIADILVSAAVPPVDTEKLKLAGVLTLLARAERGGTLATLILDYQRALAAQLKERAGAPHPTEKGPDYDPHPDEIMAALARSLLVKAEELYGSRVVGEINALAILERVIKESGE